MRGQTFSSFRASPLFTARCFIPSASSQLIPNNPQAADIEHSPNTAIAKRSKSFVKRPCFSAHGTCTVCDPCSLHCTRGTWHTIIVLNWQLSRCRQRRSVYSWICIRFRHTEQAHSVSLYRTSISTSPFATSNRTAATYQGSFNPNISSYK